MIKIFFFDLDDVILSHESSYDNQLAKLLGITPDKMEEAMLRLYKDDVLSKGWLQIKSMKDEEVYYRKFYRQLILELGLKSNEKLINKMYMDRIRKKRHRRLADQALFVINYLRSKYRLGIISNAPPSRREIELTSLGIQKLFDPIILSCEVGYKKPDPHIFMSALNKAQVEGKEAGFVDNNIENVISANSCGYKTCVLLGSEKETNGIKSIKELSELINIF